MYSIFKENINIKFSVLCSLVIFNSYLILIIEYT